MKFTELAKSLKEGLSPVYLIEGEEAYFRDHAVDAIRKACAITQPVFNETRYEGERVKDDFSAFIAALNVLPFFDEKRLVRAYGLYPTEKEWDKFLKPYTENPCPTTVLLIVNDGKRANTADLRRKKGVTFVDCSRESEETLSRWLFSLMRGRGLSADSDAVSLMVRYCASNAARMRSETEKLAVLLGEGGRVTRAVIEEQVAKDAEYKIYELTQAAARGDGAAFFEIMEDMLTKGYDEHAVLAFLTSHYRTLFEVSETRGSDEAVAKALGIKQAYAVKKNRETISRLGKERVRDLYFRLYELSCGAKSGVYSKTGALSAAVGKIFFA
ncbi:MAG: DNA polymerase III subunit delta [Clostridia bacterium]|nr:DNA polymerase III subunit delta [Clostridia bacterium]